MTEVIGLIINIIAWFSPFAIYNMHCFQNVHKLLGPLGLLLYHRGDNIASVIVNNKALANADCNES